MCLLVLILAAYAAALPSPGALVPEKSGAVAGQVDLTQAVLDLLQLGLPCTPKACKVECKKVTKHMDFHAFLLPFQSTNCVEEAACAAANKACMSKLQVAMVAAHAAEQDLLQKSELKDSAKSMHTQSAAAAAAKEAEAGKAKQGLAAAKVELQVAESDAAAAEKDPSGSADMELALSRMNAKLASFQKAKQAHLAAVAAFEGAQSKEAKALREYQSAVAAHCDAQALRAKVISYIGHEYLDKNALQNECESKGANDVVPEAH